MQQQKSSTGSDFRWWVVKNNIPEGPFSEAYIVAAFKGGAILAETLVCPVGENQWKQLCECPPFAELVSMTTSAAKPLIPPVRSVARRGRFMGLFTNPRLPRMANWICVYCLVVNPVLTILTLPLDFSDTMSVETTSPAFGLAFLWDLLCFLMSIALVVVLICGGLKLKKMKPSGRVWAITVLYLDLGTSAFEILGGIFLSALVEAIDPKVSGSNGLSMGLGLSLLILVLWLALMVFEIVALVWLHRHGRERLIIVPS